MHPLCSELLGADAHRAATAAGPVSLHTALSWLLLPLLMAQQWILRQLSLTPGQIPSPCSDVNTGL